MHDQHISERINGVGNTSTLALHRLFGHICLMRSDDDLQVSGRTTVFSLLFLCTLAGSFLWFSLSPIHARSSSSVSNVPRILETSHAALIMPESESQPLQNPVSSHFVEVLATSSAPSSSRAPTLAPAQAATQRDMDLIARAFTPAATVAVAALPPSLDAVEVIGASLATH
jgi:hypothetical protein